MASLNSSAYAQFQSIQGPTDPNLTHTLTQGYQPVSRIGEVVINCFGENRFPARKKRRALTRSHAYASRPRSRLV